MSEKFTLPSGKELEVTMGSFTESRYLYQAFLKDAKNIDFDEDRDININFFKDLLCVALSSKEIEEKLWVCMKRALYNKDKITLDTFESEEARGDYFHVCFYVVKVNILPFVKDLYAKFQPFIETMTKSFQA
jgi:hypothetical protein